MKNNTVNYRIGLLVSELGYNKNSFSNKIGLTNNSTIGTLINKEKFKPSYDVIFRIATAFPQISVDWLITGRGEMIPDKSIIAINIQKRVKKALEQMNGRMSLTEMAEALNIKKDTLGNSFTSEVPNVEVIVKLAQADIVNLGQLMYGRAIAESQGEDCLECSHKDRQIMQLQRELIDCLRK